MNPLGPRAQWGVLVARYAACLRGDLGYVAVLVGQALVIGWLCTIVWGSIERDTPLLHFVLGLAAVWLGCTAACQEIAKERAILERERFFGLSIVAYVGSKMAVLAALCGVQVLGMQIVVESKIALHGPFPLQTLALWGAALCGVGLGLVASAVARSPRQAMAAVPLLILPQILFSEFAIPEDQYGDVMAVMEKLMPARWAYKVFAEGAALEPRWWLAALDLAVLPVMAAALGGLAVVALSPRRVE